MSKRIDDIFKKKKNVLSIYFTAGYPNLLDTSSIIKHLSLAGADMIEIGFPFSDPLADGATIQKSSQIALQNGMSLQVLFEQLKDIRKVSQIPLLLMGYLNPVMQFGEENFIEKCSEIGIDGIIIPDMPLAYYQKNLQKLCQKYKIANILLISPETSERRIQEIDANSESFIYVVSSNSITGQNNDLSEQNMYFERIAKMELKNPRLIGFGIRDKKSFEQACQYASGAIIGSAFIKHLEQQGANYDAIYKFIKEIKQ
ncbi:MAG: tryptophan synthase subunit alpha [Thermonemataceae bacterium]|nr:tryptophan synthase subunit alpha [Thermonemataceae bacterium]